MQTMVAGTINKDLTDQALCHSKKRTRKLEDLKVLRRSSDLLNNFKIGQGQLQLIMKHILFYHNMGVAAILVQ